MRRYTTEQADLAMSSTYEVAERLLALLERHPGYSGNDPDIIESWGNRLRQLEREIVAEIGEAPVMTRIAGGYKVPQSFLDIYKKGA